MDRTLSAHEYPLNKVFCSDFDFRIPDYQRPYRWGTDQALQLLDDLEGALGRDAGGTYFLGSLVLVAHEGRTVDVIDGQQRLTTLTILFALLRDMVENEEFARNIASLVMDAGNLMNGIPARPRLALRDQDAAFFRSYVQERGRTRALAALTDAAATTESQRAIRDNAAALLGRLDGWTDAKLQGLASLASVRTYLVVVNTPDLDSAYRIFSVMNARGLDLTPADIFKARVIGSIDDRTAYSKEWEDVGEALGSEEFTELFRDLRTVVTGRRAQRELLTEFPEQVLDGYLDSGRATAFVDDLLRPYGRQFERTVSCEIGPGAEWKPVARWLKRLAMIDNKDWRPCALWAMVEREDDPAYLADFLRQLERLAASFLLRQSYTTPRTTRYLELLNELKSGAGLDAPSFALSEEERRLSLAALRGDVYRMQPRRARYVLLRLDELIADDPGVTYDHKIISIEHVLPQNPKAESSWRRDFTDEERERLTHRLGNLLLLNQRKNSQANNFDFETKKRRYFTTSTGSAVFALTVDVINHDTWTPGVIEGRQVELTALLEREWALNRA